MKSHEYYVKVTMKGVDESHDFSIHTPYADDDLATVYMKAQLFDERYCADDIHVSLWSASDGRIIFDRRY